MTKASESNDAPDQSERPLTGCACLDLSPTRRSGLAMSIKRVTSYVGIKPCGGCERRAAALNRWMVFHWPPHRSKPSAARTIMLSRLTKEESWTTERDEQSGSNRSRW